MDSLVRLILGKRFTLLVIGVTLVVILLNPVPGLAQTGQWSRPFSVSGSLRGSWFPEIAVDTRGVVHVVWAVSGEPGGELLYYSRWDGRSWSRPIDIGEGGTGVARSALAVDPVGRVHLLYDAQASVTYMQAPADKAGGAQGWSIPRALSGRGKGYLVDIAVDARGLLHATWTESSVVCNDCYDVFYQNSGDGGQSWSAFAQLSSLPADRRRLQMKIDGQGVIHIAWDNLDDRGKSRSAGYRFSTDGGKTWSLPREFFSPKGTASQTAIAVDGKGKVLLLWRSLDGDEIYYQVSTDGGNSWGRPDLLPGLLAVKPNAGFDRYALDTDSAGVVHLLAVGRLTNVQTNFGLYHMEWDGRNWSKPTAIYEGVDYAEHPSLVISEGNRLQVVWSTRAKDRVFEQPDETYKIWYSTAQTSAPRVTPVSIPSQTPAPQATLTLRSTATPRATRTPLSFSEPLDSDASPQGNPAFPILLGGILTFLLLGVVVVTKLLFQGSRV